MNVLGSPFESPFLTKMKNVSIASPLSDAFKTKFYQEVPHSNKPLHKRMNTSQTRYRTDRKQFQKYDYLKDKIYHCLHNSKKNNKYTKHDFKRR